LKETTESEIIEKILKLCLFPRHEENAKEK